MNTFYNKIQNVSLPEILGLAIISIPGYIIYKDLAKPNIKKLYNKNSHKIKRLKSDLKNEIHQVIDEEEENSLETKIRAESLRPGPAFVSSSTYNIRRTERVKSAYATIWNLVNQNLDLGNQSFKVTTTENDKRILNVCKNLLLHELKTDGYESSVALHSIYNEDADDNSEESQTIKNYYLDISID